MSRYESRHASGQNAPARRSLTRSAVGALRRPAVSGALALAVLGTGTAGFSLRDHSSVAAFTVSADAQAESNEAANLGIADTGRLAADRGASLAAANLNAGRAQAEAKARAEKVAQARKAAAQKAAREAERKRIIADAVENPKAAAQQLMGDYGFGDDQWGCLEQLWIGESEWNHRAENPSSGAYGIPQSLPGSKMASIADDWRTNPVTQIKWGLQYIKDSYGTPCGALNFWNSKSPHWY